MLVAELSDKSLDVNDIPAHVHAVSATVTTDMQY